jgi:flagella basal body P-ring formation protein FlgA
LRYLSNNLTRLIVVVLLTGITGPAMIAETAAMTAARVAVSKNSRVDAENIYLGKIARIESDDPVMIKRLNGVVIGRSPLPGKTRIIDTAVVKRRLKQNQINPDQISLYMPPRVSIERSLIEINRDKIASLVSDYIAKNLINNLDDARIKDIRVAENLELPGGRITYTVKPSRDSDMMGKIPFTVNFDVDGKFYKRVWATATIEVFTNVVLTKRPLGRHRPITEDDIEIQKMDLAQLPADVITDPEMILGQRTRRAIGSKTVLRSSIVEFPPLLKRGDVVVIVAESGGLKITALGQVKKKGRLGERIPVINFDSKKVLYARVVDANTVKVDLK